MKKLIYFFTICNILVAFSACSSSKDVSERRSLMMPKKSEMPRNSKKYKERERKYSYNYSVYQCADIIMVPR